MSATVRAPSPVRYALVLRHAASTRGLEVCLLQASPLLGAHLGGLEPDGAGAGRLALLVLGSMALTAHVFVFNDWAGYAGDARDPRRARLALDGHPIGREQIGRVAVALLILAGVALAAVGTSALLFGAAIAALSLLYSRSPRLGKGTPVAASLDHVIGGTAHFLLGYTTAHAVDARGVALGVVFGLVFAAGHLNQEVRDYELDKANGVASSAVVFGPRRGLLASFGVFSAAYLLIVALAVLEVLPRVLVLSVVAWLLHARWSLSALRRGPGFETALWMQRRYRLLFGLVGLAMVGPLP